MEPIYLDHSATTPLHPEVLAAMMSFFANHFGNPSSIHREGRFAREAVEDARVRVASLIGAAPAEIVFTGGASLAAGTGTSGGAIRLTLQTCSSCGILSVGNVVNGTSFVINSSNNSDASNVYWQIDAIQ